MTEKPTTIICTIWGGGNVYEELPYLRVLSDDDLGRPRLVITPDNQVLSLTYRGEYNAPIAKWEGPFRASAIRPSGDQS